ncbi:restriction endonuclease subunit S domain-containing protein [Nocardioides terrisoli]|uniref:hypothetical protein n=1 Tax=Nocardioides terrisoli TaxID=3388267 RepID=UPI00287B7A4A|nr:hypothetical protein [Nocardioides marmorisolisilvae]
MTSLTRLKRVLSEVDIRAGMADSTLPRMSVSIYSGVQRRVEPAGEASTAADLSSYKVCRDGDLVINRMRAFQGALGIAPEDGLVSPDYAVLEVASGVDRAWLSYLMTSQPFVSAMASLVKGIGGIDAGNVRTPRLNIRDLGDLDVAVPSASDQQAVVAYLDLETSRIDTLVEEQQRLVDLLHERRDVAWANVYRSLAGSAPIVSIRRVISSIVDGPFGSSLTSAHYVDEGARVVRLGNIGINEFKSSDAVYISLEYAQELEAHAVRVGDVVVAGLGDERMPLGRAAVVPDIGPAIVKADCYRVRPRQSVSSEYLAWALSAPQSRNQIALLARGATRARLNTSIMREVAIPVPDHSVQRRAVEQTALMTGKIDTLIAESERFIELSRERRSALITAAVTGQIDLQDEVSA